MRIALYILILFFIKSTFANEITIIELHNKSIDQVLIENSENENNQQSKQEIIAEDIQSDKDSINLEEKLDTKEIKIIGLSDKLEAAIRDFVAILEALDHVYKHELHH